ncbi:MAG: hemerythrin domain-containing protein [Deltaproteobacteria bacterium]|nr:hemerythrin domain-containing protein [Deltaproteobacteria bacterium]MBZ0219251.1 hemerythrin domain-containing protein [Deltaproteobacteria bacterium]
MATSENLRRQHGELLREITELVKSLNAGALKNNVEKAEERLSRLSGKLSVHVESEVCSLREAISRKSMASHRADARRFIDEMEMMLASFTSYRLRWGDPGSIRANPAGFMQETRRLFYAIAKMIEREDRGLFSLLDSAA